MHYLKQLMAVAAIVLVGFFLTNCGNDEPIITDDGNPNDTIKFECILTLSTPTVSPGKMVYLKSNKLLPVANYSASIANAKIILELVDGDSNLVFMMPELPPATYDLEFDNLSTNTINIKVEPYTKIADPAVVAKSYSNTMINAVSLLKKSTELGYENTDVEDEKVLRYVEEFNKRFIELSEEEKLQVAYFINANNLDNFDFEPIDLQDSFYAHKKAPCITPECELENLGFAFGFSVVGFGASVVGLRGLLAIKTPNHWQTVGILAAVGAAYVFASKSKKYGAELIELQAVGNQIIDPANKKYLTFTNNKSQRLKTKVSYRTLKRSDESHSSNLVATAVNDILEFNGIYNSLVDLVNKAQDIIGKKIIEISKNPVPLKDEAVFSPFMPDLNYITIANVTNGVSISKEIKNGHLYLTANAPDYRIFSFTIVYSIPKYGVYLSRAVQGEVIIPEVPTMDIEGSWNIEFYEISSNNLVGMGKFDVGADQKLITSTYYYLENGNWVKYSDGFYQIQYIEQDGNIGFWHNYLNSERYYFKVHSFTDKIFESYPSGINKSIKAILKRS